MVLGLFAVEEVQALGLEELVDLCTGDTGEDLFGHLVLDGFAVAFLALLVLAHGDETGTEADGLVGELGLVLLGVAVVCSEQRGRHGVERLSISHLIPKRKYRRSVVVVSRVRVIRTDKVSSLLVVTEAEHFDRLDVCVSGVRVDVMVVGENLGCLDQEVLAYMSSKMDKSSGGWLVLTSRATKLNHRQLEGTHTPFGGTLEHATWNSPHPERRALPQSVGLALHDAARGGACTHPRQESR